MAPFCLLLVWLVAAMQGAAAADEQTAQEAAFVDQIEDLTDRFIDDLVAKKIDEVMEMFHPDAKLALTGLPAVRGRADIRPFEEHFSEKVANVTRDYFEVAPQDPDAKYVYLLANLQWYNDQYHLIDDKKAMFVWKKATVGYKLYILITNSNL